MHSAFGSLSGSSTKVLILVAHQMQAYRKNKKFPFQEILIGTLARAALLDHQAQKSFLSGTQKILPRLREIDLAFHIVHAHALNFNATLLDESFRLAARCCERQFHEQY